MRFVLPFIKVLKMSRLFRQDQDQDQDFFFKTKIKTKTIFHVLEAPRDQDQGLETTSPSCERPAGRGLRALLAAEWRATGGVLNITAAVWTARVHWWRSGNKKRTQNVSEYMLVLALCLVFSSILLPKAVAS